ncbi:MAG TPA: drug:proton antiporter, partial [Erwinia persicina]|nr:drug:proton antiporter [Erwinia persicina]
MKALDFTILYVASPANSAAFYQRILNVDAVELSPTFAMFILPSGGRLGLWIASGVTPPVSAGTSQSEIVFTAESRDEVD